MVTLHDGKPVAKVIYFGVSKALSQQLSGKSICTTYRHYPEACLAKERGRKYRNGEVIA